MELLIELGWIQKLSFVTAPFMRFGHLREEVGVSFMAAFGSPTAGNSICQGFDSCSLIILLGTTGLIYLGIFSFMAPLRDIIPTMVIAAIIRVCLSLQHGLQAMWGHIQ
jgi:hypothetical protein